MDGLTWHRIQFTFTITYHYLFPQLTMGLALFLVAFKTLALRSKDGTYDDLARFWSRLFALNFAMGVVTGSSRARSSPRPWRWRGSSRSSSNRRFSA
jgi:cytochrome bd ubiquinol oxidase subunit I